MPEIPAPVAYAVGDLLQEFAKLDVGKIRAAAYALRKAFGAGVRDDIVHREAAPRKRLPSVSVLLGVWQLLAPPRNIFDAPCLVYRVRAAECEERFPLDREQLAAL